MEAVIEHALEPELIGTIPRRLHLPPSAFGLLIVAALLLGLFVFGSGRALWEGIKLSWLARSGQTLSGTITEIRTEAMPKGQASRQSAVRYAVDLPRPQGLLHRTGWIVLSDPPALPGAQMIPVKPQAAPIFHLGQTIPLRQAELLGVTVCQPWGSNPGSRILTLFLAGGLVMTVSLLLLRRLLQWSSHRLHLLRRGAATVGTITHKRSESEDTVRYFLRYGYAGSPAQGHEEQVSAEQWHRFHVGQPVTVLYDPASPGRAGLYALIAQK